ncbi:Uncharacterised protein [Neisseria zoodegmatis]|uniref:Uncharacterized protein n=1 Tax=Neisseria zoodegmatis TaxID=326523 RepID=A0AB38DTL5_9NEIS|nr:Uncharacterised protein [Neisseria zoodegmatis]
MLNEGLVKLPSFNMIKSGDELFTNQWVVNQVY